MPLDTAKTERDQDLDEIQKLYDEHWSDPDFGIKGPSEEFVSDEFENIQRCLENFYRHPGFSIHIKRLEARELKMLQVMSNFESEEDFRKMQARAWAMRKVIEEMKRKTV